MLRENTHDTPPIPIPPQVLDILRGLQGAGYEAYTVGGCVRDSLLGLVPNDWDICTSATPDEMKAHFARQSLRTLDTGLKHGTLTVHPGDGAFYEVTTFRVDGSYSDGRHPDSVSFVRSIVQDLSRRDFTVNAMACDQSGLIDPFGGREDLARGMIACVGEPDARFEEDALRILRALRFASSYGFSICENTARSIHKNREKLRRIAAERVRTELEKLLAGKGVLPILLEYSDVLSVVLPELAPCVGFAQNSPFHCHNVYSHIAHAVAAYEGGDPVVCAALLLHDVGKPDCYTEDLSGGHFNGHNERSRDLAEAALTRLRFDSKCRTDILELILHHNAHIPAAPKTVRKWLGKLGEIQFFRLLAVRRADALAHAEGVQKERLDNCAVLDGLARDILTQGQCCSMKDLAISGRDVMQALGLPPGKEVGRILAELLDRVIDGELDNHRETLTAFLKTQYNS